VRKRAHHSTSKRGYQRAFVYSSNFFLAAKFRCPLLDDAGGRGAKELTPPYSGTTDLGIVCIQASIRNRVGKN
jgi:hypothetical protein